MLIINHIQYESLSTMDNKEKAYQTNLQRSLIEVYNHMCNDLLSFLPAEGTDIDEDDFTRDQVRAIESVMAIEEEWMIDPSIRRENSLLYWSE